MTPNEARLIRFGLRLAQHDIARIRKGSPAVGYSKNLRYPGGDLSRRAYAHGMNRFSGGGFR